MIKLGHIANTHTIAALKKLDLLETLSVPEVRALKSFTKRGNELLKEWTELYGKFEGQISDPTVLNDLNAELAKNVDIEKLPISILDKFDQISRPQYDAMELLCE